MREKKKKWEQNVESYKNENKKSKDEKYKWKEYSLGRQQSRDSKYKEWIWSKIYRNYPLKQWKAKNYFIKTNSWVSEPY